MNGDLSSSAKRFFAIAEALCWAVGKAIRPGFISAMLAMIVVRRIKRVRWRLLMLETRFLAGLAMRRAKRVEVTAVREQPVSRAVGERLPRGLGWLCPLVPSDAACYAGQLRVVLAEPEMQALLAACPQAVRVVAPLCRMLGIERALYVPGFVAVPVRVRAPRAPRVKPVVTDPREAHYAISGVPRRFWFKVPRRWK